MLGRRGLNSPRCIGYRELADRFEPREVTYQELADRASAVAELVSPIALPGQRIALSLAPGLDYLAGFLGCLLAQTVAVPLPPRSRNPVAALDDVAGNPIIRDSGAVAALTPAGVLDLRLLDDHDREAAAPASLDIAMLQYTSGSTGLPKGIMVTHDNLASNVSAVCAAMEVTTTDRGVIWLPPYHDMGLIGGLLVPLWAGIPVTLMSPAAFVRRPLAWLEAISADRATISGGPNFAYEACVMRTTPEQRAALDLSSWEVAFVGAEPVRAQTLRRFAQAFEVAGFAPSAFYPCYGLAESTLIVTGVRRGSGATVISRPDDSDAPPLVGVGTPLHGGEVAILDSSSGQPVADGVIGEIAVKGSSVARGYWRNAVATAEVFGADGWLRTGDLGFFTEGMLSVSGRSKNVIVIRGRNIFAEDVEAEVASCDAALAGCAVVAFAADLRDQEELVVVVELPGRPGAESELTAVLTSVRSALVRLCGVRPGCVALVRRGKLPRTSSGKLRRSVARASYLAGTLPVLAQSQPPQGQSPQGQSPQGQSPQGQSPQGQPQVLEEQPASRRAAEITSWLQVWCADLLGVPASQIDSSVSLVDAGLDSLTLTQLQADLAAELGAAVTLTELFESDSVAGLAAAVAEGPVRPRPEADADVLAAVRTGDAGRPRRRRPRCGFWSSAIQVRPCTTSRAPSRSGEWWTWRPCARHLSWSCSGTRPCGAGLSCARARSGRPR